MSTFQQQVDEAHKNIKAAKRATPWIFPEWQRVQRAMDALEAARSELDAARQAWRDL